MVTQITENKSPTTDNNTQIIAKALDKLALALTGHHHQWTGEERKLYEEAIALLTS